MLLRVTLSTWNLRELVKVYTFFFFTQPCETYACHDSVSVLQKIYSHLRVLFFGPDYANLEYKRALSVASKTYSIVVSYCDRQMLTKLLQIRAMQKIWYNRQAENSDTAHVRALIQTCKQCGN